MAVSHNLTLFHPNVFLIIHFNVFWYFVCVFHSFVSFIFMCCLCLVIYYLLHLSLRQFAANLCIYWMFILNWWYLSFICYVFCKQNLLHDLTFLFVFLVDKFIYWFTVDSILSLIEMSIDTVIYFNVLTATWNLCYKNLKYI